MTFRTPAILFFCLFFVEIFAQTGVKWQTDFGNGTHANAVRELADGSFIVAGDSTVDAFLAKTDADGQVLWKKYFGQPNPFAETFRSVQALPDGGFFAVGERLQTLSGDYDFYVIRTDAAGDTVWTKTFGGSGNDFFAKGQPTADGGFIIAGRTGSIDGDATGNHGGLDVLLIKLAQNGSISWEKTFGGTANDFGNGIRQTPDGGYLVFGATFSNDGDVAGNHGQSDAWLFKVDAGGNLVFQKTFGGTSVDAGYDLTATPDGNFALAAQAYSLDGDLAGVHSQASASDGWLVKIGPSGTILWQKCLRENGGFSSLEVVEVLAGGGLAVTGNYVTGLAAVLDDLGNLIWQPDFGGVSHSQGLAATADGGFAVDFSITKIVRFVAPHLLTGHVFRDENADCIFQNNEIPLFQRLLRAEKPGSPPVFFQSKTDGSFSVLLDEGAWTVTAFPPSGIWETCPPQTVVFQATTVAKIADFGIKPLGDCPLMAVDLATDVIRPCFASHYTLQYCNIGTKKSDSTRVEITLDEFLTFQNPSQTPGSATGQKIVFNLGEVGAGDCGTLMFEALADCDSVKVGSYKCVAAHIFPDSFCVAPAGWTGGRLRIDGICAADSVRFTATNIGFGQSQPVEFVIIEDEVLTRTGTIPGLAPNGIFAPAGLPKNGKTWRMEAGPQPLDPADTHPASAVEACGTNATGTYSIGIANNFPEDDAAPSIDVDCRQTVAAFDPNAKENSPQGVGFQHFTEYLTDLEYTIRFQNLGSFFATDVVILDTLDAALDPSTLRFGTASHYPLTWEITGAGVLKVSFDNIQLPFPLLDEPGSHGWVHFRVGHRKDIPLGTIIPNRAGIYFDFNPVVLTQTVYNTMDTSFLEVLIDTHGAERPGGAIALKFYPNPLGASGELFFLEKENLEGAIFQLTDLSGRLVFSQKMNGDGRIVLPVAQCGKGMFAIQILDEKGQRLGAGKLVVH